VRVYAFEPTPLNYAHFVKNIELNGVTNIVVENMAITSDRRDLQMIMNPENTGGATANLGDMTKGGHETYTVRSITLDDVFERHGIERCRLLKIDCEGSEHEILRSTQVLNRVDWIVGEFHINTHLESQGYSIENLVAYLETYLPRKHIRYEPCRMAE
jgi:FkbM family methyltransferase